MNTRELNAVLERRLDSLTPERFKILKSRRLTLIEGTLLRKNQGEYAKGAVDALQALKTAGLIKQELPEVALWGMVVKHFMYALDMAEGRQAITQEQIDEKLGDMMVYQILLEGLLTERLLSSPPVS